MPRAKNRRRAREVALQALYELESTRHAVAGVLANTAVLDEQIQRHAPEWPLEQMAIIDRSILRIALWEFSLGRQTPVKVAINEAVELAKEYGSDSAPRFVNGVLGAAAAELSAAAE